MWTLKFKLLSPIIWRQHINSIFLIASLFIFLIGMGIGLYSNQVVNTSNTRHINELFPQNKTHLFNLIFKNNIIIFFTIIIGFITFSLTSTIILLYNGYIFGYCFKLISFKELLLHFFPHAIPESFAYILGYYISLNISRKIYFYLKGKTLSYEIKKYLQYIAIGVFTIFLSALIESYVSIR